MQIHDSTELPFVYSVHLFRPTWLVASVGHTNLPLYSACCLHPSKPEHRWSRLRFTPLRLTTASAFGSRDCRLRLHYRLHRHRSCVTVSGRCHCAWDNKLSWHLHFRFLIDTSVSLRCRCSPIPMRPETSACFSEPSMPRCCAPSSNRTVAILTAEFSHPQGVEADNITSPRPSSVIRLRR